MDIDEKIFDFLCARMVLLIAHDDGKIDDEELIMLNLGLEEDESRLLQSVPREFGRFTRGPRLNLDSLSDQCCLEYFRFNRAKIRDLCRFLDLPQRMRADNRIEWSSEEGLCILLRRLAYPCRLVDLQGLFGRNVSDIGRIANAVCLFIVQRWRHLIESFTEAPWFCAERVQRYVEATSAKCPLPNCWGFLDGTVRPMCRPTRQQRAFYNGHKRVHSLKFQSIVAPDGIIVHMHGPALGKRHDSGMLRESGLLDQLEHQMPVPPEGGAYCIFGDQAYPLRPQLITPYKGNNLTEEQADFNRQMSEVRISAEWGFQKVLQLFAFVDFKKNLKVQLQPIAAYYLCATILTNCHTCLNRSVASFFFDVRPPTLAEYLA